MNKFRTSINFFFFDKKTSIKIREGNLENDNGRELGQVKKNPCTCVH